MANIEYVNGEEGGCNQHVYSEGGRRGRDFGSEVYSHGEWMGQQVMDFGVDEVTVGVNYQIRSRKIFRKTDSVYLSVYILGFVKLWFPTVSNTVRF